MLSIANMPIYSAVANIIGISLYTCTVYTSMDFGLVVKAGLNKLCTADNKPNYKCLLT